VRSLLIVGSGGHSRPIIGTVKKLKMWNLIGVVDLNYKGVSEKILNTPVLGSLEILNDFKPANTDVFLAVGNNKLRRSLFLTPKVNIFNTPNIVHPTAFIDPSVEMGVGNFVGPFVNIGPMVKIGKSNIINSYANLEHETQVGSFCQFSPGSIICGRCLLGSEIFVGANATIIEKQKIADNSIIGAGSVIIKDILKRNQTIVGVPGKPN